MDRSEFPPVVDRPSFLRNVAALLVQRYGSKAFEAILLAYAFRTLPDRAIGLVFFVQATAGIAFQAIDFGLVPIITRRAAWGRVDGGLLLRLTLGRAVGVAALTLAYAGYAARTMGADATIASGFFFAAGLQSVHDVPRAAAAGLERFDRLSVIGLVGKAIETAISVVGFVVGLGLPAWFAGRVASHLAVAALSIPLARSSVRRAETSASVRAVVKEGLPFWWSTLLSLFAIRLDTIFVAVFAGLEETAQIGVASRVLGGVLGVVSAATFAAFPRLARDRRRFVRRREATIVLAFAVAIGLGVHACAPIIVRIVEGRFDAGTIGAVRAMAPMASIFALSRPLETWLQAKRQESLVSKVATVHVVLVALLLAVLVPRFGVEGAAIARPIRAAIELVGLAVAATLALSPVPSPMGYVLATLGWLRSFVRAGHRARCRREERRLLSVPEIDRVHVSCVGPLGDEPGFAHHRLVGVARGGSTVTARGVRVRTLAGWIDVLILDAATFEAMLALEASPPESPTAERVRGARRLVDAVRAFIAMQRIAIAQSRPDGRVRLDLLRLETRVFREALAEDGIEDDLPTRGARPTLGHFDGELAADLLADAYRRLGVASARFAERCLPFAETRPPLPLGERPSSLDRLHREELCEAATVVVLGPRDEAHLTVVTARAYGASTASRAFSRFVRIVGPESEQDDRSTTDPIVLPESTLGLIELLGDPPLATHADIRAPSSYEGVSIDRRSVEPEVRRTLAIDSLVRLARDRLVAGDERAPFRVDARARLSRRDLCVALLGELGVDAPAEIDVGLDRAIHTALVTLARSRA